MDLLTYRKYGNSTATVFFALSFVFLFLLRGDQFDAFFPVIAIDLLLLVAFFTNAVVVNLLTLFKKNHALSSLSYLAFTLVGALMIGYVTLFLVLSAG